MSFSSSLSDFFVLLLNLSLFFCLSFKYERFSKQVEIIYFNPKQKDDEESTEIELQGESSTRLEIEGGDDKGPPPPPERGDPPPRAGMATKFILIL